MAFWKPERWRKKDFLGEIRLSQFFRNGSKIIKTLNLPVVAHTHSRTCWITHPILICNSALWLPHCGIERKNIKYTQTQHLRNFLRYFCLLSLALNRILSWYVRFVGEWPQIPISIILEIMCYSIFTAISKQN